MKCRDCAAMDICFGPCLGQGYYCQILWQRKINEDSLAPMLAKVGAQVYCLVEPDGECKVPEVWEGK